MHHASTRPSRRQFLLALPASAALLVALRHLRAVYLASRFYNGTP